MSEKPIEWQVKTAALVTAIDAANKLSDVVVLVEMALEQLQGYHKSNSESHRVTLLLQAAQDVLRVEVKTLQCKLEECQQFVEKRR